MEQNKTGKYLKYAIGEIVLVVVGILIALSINNWNVARIQQQKEVINLIELKKGLESDLNKELIPGIEYYIKAEEALNKFDSYNNNIETISNDSLGKYFFTFVASEWNFVFNTSAFENLKSTGIDIISNDSLRTKISFVYSYEYLNISDRSKSNIKYLETQVHPVLMDHINLFGGVALSNNELKSLKNNIKITNRLNKLRGRRIFALSGLNESKLIVESLINDIVRELESIDK